MAADLVSDFYRDREALRAEVRRLAAAPGARALDVGCKHGDISRSLARTQGYLAALDIERHAEWLVPATGLDFLNASAMALPFPDATFDVVVSSECLQYVPDPEAAIDEMARVLRPGGILVVSFPEGNWLTTWLDPDNLSYCWRRLLRPSSLGGRSFVRHLRVGRIRRRAESRLATEVVLRRGTLVFIYAAGLIDLCQGLRLRLMRRDGLQGRLADACLRTALELLFGIMNLDTSLSPPWLWYNNVLRFRKAAR